MKGADLLAELTSLGFTVSRRSKTLVWLVRGGEQLLIDSDAEVAEELSHELLARARQSGRPPPARGFFSPDLGRGRRVSGEATEVKAAGRR